MTFGTEWGWGSPRETVFALMDRYLEAGGNFIDTADGYTGGRSEEFIGEFFAERGGRDSAVIATKFSFNQQAGDPNAGGNGRKNIYRALEGSLRRLKTDSVDVDWLHAWDGNTPVEEVMSTLDALVRAGKVRAIGFSNVPGWYLGRAQTMAEWRGWEPLCALQLEYSLVERNLEREHVPAALALGLGVCPWSPLASGLLTGKYRREGLAAEGEGRMKAIRGSANPSFQKILSERNWTIVETLVEIAGRIGRSPAQVAINWVASRPGVVSTLIGATQLAQLEDNLHALDFELPPADAAKLEEISRPASLHPYLFFEPTMRAMIDGGVPVGSRQAR
jgi:aryl-alcohol dehydrogenase-like predicted oxidoreductase